MKIYVCFMIFMVLLTVVACSYSINMIHSEGSTDTLDDTQAPTTNVNPNLTIPGLK